MHQRHDFISTNNIYFTNNLICLFKWASWRLLCGYWSALITGCVIIFIVVHSGVAHSGMMKITYHADNQFTISKGNTWSDWSLPSDKCKKNQMVGLIIQTTNIKTLYSSSVPGVSTQLIGGTGDCVAAIGSLLPYTATLPTGAGEISCIMVYYSSHIPVDGFCYSMGSGFEVEIEGLSCDITSGDVIHSYGTLSSDDVEGKTMTTQSVVTCTGLASMGTASVELALKDESIKLNDDGSLLADLDIDGKGQKTTINVPTNNSVNFNVTSSLRTNGDVSVGSFSGSTALTITYD